MTIEEKAALIHEVVTRGYAIGLIDQNLAILNDLEDSETVTLYDKDIGLLELALDRLRLDIEAGEVSVLDLPHADAYVEVPGED